MKYKIQITEIREETTTKEGEWAVIDTRPWTAEEVNSQIMDQDTESFLENNPLKDIYGYTHERETTETVATEIFCQTTDELDLKKVIQAVNGITDSDSATAINQYTHSIQIVGLQRIKLLYNKMGSRAKQRILN